MNNILAKTKYTVGSDKFVLRAEGGLHYIKGNSSPYFALTCAQYMNGREDTFGANLELILKHFPEFADLAAMHLSDMDGAPMHATANGWYNLAGCFPDAFGDKYHRGNGEMHFTDGYRKPTGDECLQFFADHCRIPLAEAASIRDQVFTAAMAARSDRNAVARAKCAEILNSMRPRWKLEADACIAKHNLKVYGDVWSLT